MAQVVECLPSKCKAQFEKKEKKSYLSTFMVEHITPLFTQVNKYMCLTGTLKKET
jgi:hypothetical protein